MAGQRPRRPVRYENGNATGGKDWTHGDRADRRHPATFLLVDVRGRSPGSEDLTHRLPVTEESAQWHSDEFTLPYRCGGSTGIASGEGLTRTCFPFHLPADCEFGHAGTADMRAAWSSRAALCDFNRKVLAKYRSGAMMHFNSCRTFQTTLKTICYYLTAMAFCNRL